MSNEIADQLVLLAASDDVEDALEFVLYEFPMDKLEDFKEKLGQLLHDTYHTDFEIAVGDDMDDEEGDEDFDDEDE